VKLLDESDIGIGTVTEADY